MQPIIDADAHITEPRDVWSARAPQKYVDELPQVVRNDQGEDVWVLGGEVLTVVGRTAPAGWEAFPASFPATYEDCHPGAYDSAARLAYMDEAGLWAQVLYPNVGGFGAQKFLRIPSDEIKIAAVKIYNDFQEEWCEADRRRLLPIAALPYWDLKATVNEIERCKEHGFAGVLFTGEPQRFDLPLLGDKHWDPLWDVAQAANMPIHFHIGGGENERSEYAERTRVYGRAASDTLEAVKLFLKNGTQCADLLMSGVLQRYPDLKFVSVESGIGWIPFMLETADYSFLGSTEPGRKRSSALLPSELFARQVYCTYWFENIAPAKLMEEIPVDNILFETDFPHVTCLYKDDVVRAIDTGLGGVSEEARRKIIWDNAAKLYGVEEPALV